MCVHCTNTIAGRICTLHMHPWSVQAHVIIKQKHSDCCYSNQEKSLIDQ